MWLCSNEWNLYHGPPVLSGFLSVLVVFSLSPHSPAGTPLWVPAFGQFTCWQLTHLLLIILSLVWTWIPPCFP